MQPSDDKVLWSQQIHVRHTFATCLGNLGKYIYKWEQKDGGDTNTILQKLADFETEADLLFHTYGRAVVGDQLAIKYCGIKETLAHLRSNPRPRDRKKEVPA